MRLKIIRVMPMAFAAMLFSCQQTELADSGVSNEVEMNLFDLQEFNYNDVQELLSNKQEVVNIQFKDGEIVRNVGKLKVKTGLELAGDDEQAAKTVFYEGAPEDSISVIMDGTYASVKMIKDGKELGYVAFVDSEDARLAANKYEEEYVATRNSDAALPLTRDAGRNVLKFDLTEMGKLVSGSECHALEAEEGLQANEQESPVASTRTAYYTQWPRGNTLTIHLIRDAGDTPWEYELNWQVDDLVSSIRNISYTNVKIWRSSTGYRSNKRYIRDSLEKFRRYCQSGDFPWSEAANHDIIMLVTHFEYSNGSGMAYIDAYKQSRYENSWAYGVSATSAVNSKTLAHEVGHILGAQHVATSPWWKFWAKDDVMSYGPLGKRSNLHFDRGNRDRIWNNLNR